MPSVAVISKAPEETRALGVRFARILKSNDVLILSGDLGAGKTEFAQGVAEGLGITEPVNSPTFNLLLVHPIDLAAAAEAAAAEAAAGFAASAASGPVVSPYRAKLEQPHSLYHFDLYRLDDSSQLEDIDYFASLEDGAVSLVEWGDRFSEAMPVDYLLIEITTMADESRELRFSAFGRQSKDLLDQWCDLAHLSDR